MNVALDSNLDVTRKNAKSSCKEWFSTAVLDYGADDGMRSASRPGFVTAISLCKVNGFDLWIGQPTRSTWSAPLAHVKFAPVGDLQAYTAGPIFLLAHAADGESLAPRAGQNRTRMALNEVLAEAAIKHLGFSLEPALRDPATADRSFVDLACSTIRAFVASRLTVSAAPKKKGGGLAPWQQRCATELMLSNIGDHVPVADLAFACRVSESHFVRAFRQSTGLPPHQWVLARRIEKSKELLAGCPSQSLSEVAIECGFADQSHFTRTFSRIAGLTPGAWRRFAAATRDSRSGVSATIAQPYAKGLPRASASSQSGLGERL